MNEIKKFNEFKLFEKSAASLSGKITLYRLSSYDVVKLDEPGSYYVSSRKDINPDLLKKKGKNLYLITVKTDASNIDLNKSEKESVSKNVPSVVVVKNDTKCELVDIKPWGKKED